MAVSSKLIPITLVMALGAAIFLTGCSDQTSSSSSDGIANARGEATTMTLSEAFRGDDFRIWYEVNDTGKDGYVSSMYVVENGKVVCYETVADYVLGSFAKVNDSGILDSIEEKIAEEYEMYGSLGAGSKEIPVEFHLVTDKTGNNVSYEEIKLGTRTLKIRGLVGPFQVYDSVYAGYNVGGYNLVTHINPGEDITFITDGINAANVTID